MISINLLPPELKLKRIEAKKNASLISICIVALFFVIILGLISSVGKETVNAYLNSIQANIKQNQTETAEAQNMEKMALFINDRYQAFGQINAKRAIWSQILTDLAADVPTDIQFDNFSADTTKSPNFTLTGNAPNEREIIKFKDKLDGSQFFKNVNFQSSSLNQNQQTNTQTIKFTLEFDLRKLSSAGKALSGGGQ